MGSGTDALPGLDRGEQEVMGLPLATGSSLWSLGMIELEVQFGKLFFKITSCGQFTFPPRDLAAPLFPITSSVEMQSSCFA